MWAVTDPITEIIAYYLIMEDAERGLKNLLIMREEYPYFQDYQLPFIYQTHTKESS